jgi:hypothetical protein
MKKLNIQIKSIWGSLLFEYECEANTPKKTLEKAVSKKANLWGANLGEADLRGADLRRANLGEADLRGADLGEADLGEADLGRANLWEADLRGADLRRANLWGANLRGAKGLKLYWHIHHDQLVENLTEPLKNRIGYIKKEKPKEEVKLRVKLIKKVKAKPKDWPITKEGWEELHKKECKNCSWNGNTIFPNKP